MSEENKVEKVNGVWQGTPISIKKVWGKNSNWEGHEFTADEAARLFNGETISFEAISKAGKPYDAKGLLAQQSFVDDDGNTHEFIGFKLIFEENSGDQKEKFTGIWNGKSISVNRKWSDHRFTDEEVEKLLKGESISFEATSKKNGAKYTASGKLEEQEYEGRTFVGFKPVFN